MSASKIALVVFVLITPLGAAAEDYRHTVEVEPGGTLDVDLTAGSIEVETHDNDEVSVDAHFRGWGTSSMRFELSSDGVDATLIGRATGWNPFFGGLRIRGLTPSGNHPTEKGGIHVSAVTVTPPSGGSAAYVRTLTRVPVPENSPSPPSLSPLAGSIDQLS